MEVNYLKSTLSALGFVFQLFCFAGCSQNGVPGVSAPPSNSPVDVSTPSATQPTGTGEALAFPGAEGFGKFTTGGRGGQVIIVSTLNDDGPGSLREAVRKKGPRIIVFSISGNIKLESALDINNPDLTIAGQSAPGQGICLQNYPVNIKADNVIVRYLRFRMGDLAAQQGDAVGANKGMNNIIVDHCSMSWGTDESASFYRNSNFTLQWSIIAESLNESVHAKGDHGYGGIWGGKGASFHHNLIATHNSRTPRFSGSSTTPNSAEELVDFTNNVIFNWGQNNIYGGEKGRYNLVNNYFKPGPATAASKKDRIVEPYRPFGKFYVSGNFVEGFPTISQNNWNGGVQVEPLDSVKAVSPFQVVAVPSQTPQAAYENILSIAGASYQRDAVDTRIVAYVRSGNPSAGKKNNGIIDSQADVGGWPVLNSVPAPVDKDKDGMPDAWEVQQSLNPSDAADAAAYTLDNQYTNLEVYLNNLVK